MTNRFAISLVLLMLCTNLRAETVQVAVAANFAAPMQEIAALYEKNSSNAVLVSVGSTGKFVTQIRNGAPFDLLLAADEASPASLHEQAVPGTQFTYAIGSLVLWSASAGFVDAQGSVLKQGHFAHLALANPQQAPYGSAALETLTALQLRDLLLPKIVQGESIGQTYTFVATGNAELGFVALSQVWAHNKIKSGSAWLVPQKLYTPLRQDAVLLTHGEHNAAAMSLLAFLKSAAARQIMTDYGYHF